MLSDLGRSWGSVRDTQGLRTHRVDSRSLTVSVPCFCFITLAQPFQGQCVCFKIILLKASTTLRWRKTRVFVPCVLEHVGRTAVNYAVSIPASTNVHTPRSAFASDGSGQAEAGGIYQHRSFHTSTSHSDTAHLWSPDLAVKGPFGNTK